MQRTGGASLTSDATKRRTRGRRRIGVLLVVAAIVAALDQITKVIAVEALADGRVVPVIGEILQLRLIRNPGAAFGIGTNLTVFLAAVMIIVIVVIIRMSRQLFSVRWAIALGGLLGGAIGNLGDRIFRQPGPLRGHVVDFIDYGLFVGNVADIAIVCGASLIAVLSLWGIAHDGSHRHHVTKESDDGDADDADGAIGEADPGRNGPA